jgi:Ca-activated chloride channel family protein
MNLLFSRRSLLLVAAVSAVALGIATAFVPKLWLTPDQHGDQLMRERKYAEAAKTYADPLRRATAFYRAGDFEKVGTALSGVAGAVAAFDRGDALLMRGKYLDAVNAFDRALKLRPGWKEAEENRALALARDKLLHPPGGPTDVDGQDPPDAIVFDKNKSRNATDEVDLTEGSKLSDEEIRGLWLRRLQTKPADFLRAKFAFQAQEQGKESR